MRDPRIDKLAQVLVNYSVAAKKGDLIRISAPPIAEPLVVAIYREILRAGAHPVVRMAPEECQEIFLKDASSQQIQYISPLAMHEVETINATIGIWADDNTKALTNVDPKRQAAASRARKPILDLFMKRAAKKGKAKLRWSGTQFPCQAAAQDAEMSLAEYEDFVFAAGKLDAANPVAEWKKLSTRQQRVTDFLNKAREIRFITPQGTDLQLGVKGRHWINCDGHENFPDGEVFTGPIEDATEGVVCYSFPAVHGGREVHDIRLRFRNGRVVDASASKGEDFLIQMLDQDRGSRCLGEIALGTNYTVRQYTRNTLFDEKIGGTFHAAVGAAYPETGGRNDSGLHWDMVCDLRKGGRIEVDGKVISKNGRFLNKAWPQPTRR
ncbi:MAG: aminopeptidase [Phycisphaerae bacterium]|nr:aminopeptidase [Phycisphaerae bacterium]